MESFYSVIYYKTNPLTDEMLSIGLLAGGGEGPFMYVSNARLDLLKKILHPNTFLSVRRHIKFLQEKVGNHRNEAAGILLFDPVFSVEQMETLAQRSKNAIAYSQPTTINEWLDASFFAELTKAFFGENLKPVAKKRPVFHLKWKAFYHSAKFKNWERDLPLSKIIASSPLSISLDLAKPNGEEVMKGIDFDLSETSLNRKLYELELIVNALPKCDITIVHPTPKKNSGKELFQTTKDKFPKIVFRGFSEFKNLK
ncbi:hypothetical protein [Brumimicrobium oceani]|uniref:DUF3037 domain-containing protein n=1 Tax=Brumimicrobium oceani TaxID=2100725 RepID=A0A2U2XGJ5_9FLAO|nr:hypothetical protein [Brumimicrobium oceani]PWH86915.1 hypothetical protein DIT68_01250 [Brumimicrobium oceani]